MNYLEVIDCLTQLHKQVPRASLYVLLTWEESLDHTQSEISELSPAGAGSFHQDGYGQLMVKCSFLVPVNEKPFSLRIRPFLTERQGPPHGLRVTTGKGLSQIIE